jgi:8-oxo-dGTP pyrophosphatase MutT (NUDIX family)
MVREQSAGREVINQPAGHLENRETLLQAVVRETLEETRWRITPTAVLGLYHYTSSNNNVTYVRVCFIAEPVEEVSNAPLDPDIIEPVWLTPDQIRASGPQLRSPIVVAAIEDYQRGISYPLSLIGEP